MVGRSDSPLGDGRTPNGRFAPGNPGGPGNPYGRRVAALRAALLDAVSEDDIRAVATKLVELARSGDTRAIKELLDRLLGKPQEADLIERIEQLETLLQEAAR